MAIKPNPVQGSRQPQSTSPPLIESVNEAAQHSIAGSARLENLLDVITASQMRDIADDELAVVNAFRNKKLGLNVPNVPGIGEDGSRMGSRDIILAENMHWELQLPQQQQQQPASQTPPPQDKAKIPAALWGLGGAAAASPLLLWLGMHLAGGKEPTPAPKPGTNKTVEVSGPDKRVEIELKRPQKNR